MELYNRQKWWKFLLIVGAAVISLFSLLYTNRLSAELKSEEQKKMLIWAEASRLLSIDASPGEKMSLFTEIISQNTTVPVIITNSVDSIIAHRNVNLSKSKPEKDLYNMLQKMKRYHAPFPVELSENDFQYIYYADSTMLIKLQWFPIVQLIVVFVFMLVAYLGFSVARQLEQDQVWVGMARETAHQLGTPTTSLLGWIDVLALRNTDPKLVNEIRFDVKRLQTITSRFSKIGSRPQLEYENIVEVIKGMIDYLKKRSSELVVFDLIYITQETMLIPISRPLFEWVIENLCKNAIDAMKGEGKITITIERQKEQAVINITDNGKGMARTVQKTVFKPGYSTKARGWGLGLTLSKRIIEHYHKGKIFILSSVPGKGTTFSITLPSSDINDKNHA